MASTLQASARSLSILRAHKPHTLHTPLEISAGLSTISLLRTRAPPTISRLAGSHGFEIVGPHGSALNYTVAHELLPTIERALVELQRRLTPLIPGVSLEDNK